MPDRHRSESSASSESKRSNFSWKVIAIVFIVLTIGASALAYFYYGQNQNNISNSVSNTADRNYYYSQWQSDESKITSLNQQISFDNSQIAADKTAISADQSQITQLQSELYNPLCKPNCDSQISQLNAQITTLNAQIGTDNSLIAADSLEIQSLNAQIANLQSILGLGKTQVIARDVTINEPQCGETNQPICQGSSACTNPANCTPQYILPNNFQSFCSPSCDQGVLLVNWTSTQSMTVSFTSSFHGSSTISMFSSSSTAGDFAFPIIANFSSTGSLTANGFHNDSCTKDISGNYHCAAVSLTYWETFVY